MTSTNTNNQFEQQNQSNADTHQTSYLQGKTTYHAQPYSLDAEGFYFTNMDEYNEKVEALRDCYGNPVEEFEIQFIDGSSEESALFQAANVDQCTLPRFLEILDEVPEHQYAALFFMMEQGRDLEDAFNNYDEVQAAAGRLEDAAEELFDEMYGHEIPEHLKTYIDYQAFANDCQCAGDLVEFEFAGDTYTCTNASSL